MVHSHRIHPTTTRTADDCRMWPQVVDPLVAVTSTSAWDPAARSARSFGTAEIRNAHRDVTPFPVTHGQSEAPVTAIDARPGNGMPRPGGRRGPPPGGRPTTKTSGIQGSPAHHSEAGISVTTSTPMIAPSGSRTRPDAPGEDRSARTFARQQLSPVLEPVHADQIPKST